MEISTIYIQGDREQQQSYETRTNSLIKQMLIGILSSRINKTKNKVIEQKIDWVSTHKTTEENNKSDNSREDDKIIDDST